MAKGKIPMTKPFVTFMDIDGPLATHRSNYGTGDFFDPVSAGMLARVCRDTGMKLVICSARRHDDGLRDKLASLDLSQHLFPHPNHWRTGHDPMAIRGNEIDAWLAANPGHEWAILDDERGGYAPRHIRRLVHTDMHAGLQMRDVALLRAHAGQTTMADPSRMDRQTPRITLGVHARDALAALDQGDDDAVRTLLAIIADHPLAR